MLLYILISPFAAALLGRFGIRRVVCSALVLIAAGSGLTVFMTQAWQLVATWGLLVGVGVGSMPFVATIAGRWFVRVRGLVSAARTRGFCLLAGGFAICGAATNGLVGTHFLTAAPDHGMPPTIASGPLRR